MSLDSTGEPIENGDSADEADLQNETDPIKRKYGRLVGDIFSIDIALDRPGQELGLVLAGNRRVDQMNTYIALVREGGVAFDDGRLEVGDEILELNGHKVHERSHLNVGMIMKNLNSQSINVLFMRHPDNLKKMALNNRSPFLKPKQRERKRSSVGMIAINKEAICNLQQQQQQQQQSEQPGEQQEQQEQKDIQPEQQQEKQDIDVEVPENEKSEELENSSLQTRQDEKSPPTTPPPTTPPTTPPTPTTTPPTPPTPTTTPPTPPTTPLKTTKTPDRLPIPGEKAAVTAPLDSKPAGARRGSRDSAVDDAHVILEISRLEQELGVCLIGGSDTLLGSIVVSDISSHGAACKDGRLRVGDVITKINNTSLEGRSREEAMHLLLKGGDAVTMEIDRSKDTTLNQDNNYEIITVELVKKVGQGFGLTIIGKHQDSDVYICELMKGWAAEVDGRLQPGDLLVSINDKEFKGQTAAAELLKSSADKVKIAVKRLKRAAGSDPR